MFMQRQELDTLRHTDISELRRVVDTEHAEGTAYRAHTDRSLSVLHRNVIRDFRLVPMVAGASLEHFVLEWPEVLAHLQPQTDRPGRSEDHRK